VEAVELREGALHEREGATRAAAQVDLDEVQCDTSRRPRSTSVFPVPGAVHTFHFHFQRAHHGQQHDRSQREPSVAVHSLAFLPSFLPSQIFMARVDEKTTVTAGGEHSFAMRQCGGVCSRDALTSIARAFRSYLFSLTSWPSRGSRVE